MIDSQRRPGDETRGYRDWNARLIEFFVGNPRLVILVLVAILLGGALSLVGLQREGFPDVTPKILFVQTVYPGAGSEEVERQVTRTLEAALKDADGVAVVRSGSMNSFSQIVVELDAKADTDRATQEVRNKVIAAESDLPEDADKPEVTTLRISGFDYIIGISGQDDIGPLSDSLVSELTQVSGVKSVKPMIDRSRRIVVAVDPAKLAAAGLGIDQLSQMLKGSNVNFPVARIDLDNRNQNLVVVGALTSVRQLRRAMIGVDPLTQRPLRLADVATIAVKRASSEDIDRFGSSPGDRVRVRSGALLGIDTAADADIIRTRAALDKRIADLKADGDIPKQARVEFIEDSAVDTRKQVGELISGALGNRSNLWLLGGIQLVLIAMLLFVNFRAAVIAALSIPLSLGFTFIALQVMGLTLNTIVLFSLVLVLGLIVDPAIVIVESIQRYRDLGYDPLRAIQATGRRYGAGVFMATLTNWIVFVPFGVVSGIFGQIIRFLPLTVIPALVASYFVPVAILPWLASRFLKRRPVETEDEVASLSAAARGMMAANRWVLDRAWRQLVVLAAALVLVALSVSLVATGRVQVVQFSKPDDNDRLALNVTFSKGLTYDQRDRIARKIEREIKREKGIKSFYYAEQDRDHLMADVRLKDGRGSDDRSKLIASRLRKSLTGKRSYEFQAMEIGYTTPEPAYQIQVQLYDSNMDRLKKAATDVGRYLSKLDGVTKVDDGVNSYSEPEVRLVLDRPKAEARGLSAFQVGQALKAVLDETKVTKFDDPERDRTMDVVLKIDGDSRPKESDDLDKLTVSDRVGQPVALSQVARLEKAQSLARIERYQGQRFLTVRARVKEGRLFDVQRRLDDYLSPDRLKDLDISDKGNRGEFEDIAKSFTELFIALLIAIGLTYLVLVLQFRSFAQPMIMLFTIPPSLIGVFPVLWLVGSDFGFLELLGITILVGIVENVAIFLIDYANQRIRQEGMDPKEAIILASGIRFRPIILTKLVAFAGLLPLAIESPFWRGLSMTIIAGIGLSGLFSMLIIPILFMLIVRLEQRLGFEL